MWASQFQPGVPSGHFAEQQEIRIVHTKDRSKHRLVLTKQVARTDTLVGEQGEPEMITRQSVRWCIGVLLLVSLASRYSYADPPGTAVAAPTVPQKFRSVQITVDKPTPPVVYVWTDNLSNLPIADLRSEQQRNALNKELARAQAALAANPRDPKLQKRVVELQVRQQTYAAQLAPKLQYQVTPLVGAPSYSPTMPAQPQLRNLLLTPEDRAQAKIFPPLMTPDIIAQVVPVK